MKDVQWYVAARGELADNLPLFLAEHGISEDESRCQKVCSDGEKRDLWRIPAEHIKNIQDALKRFSHFEADFFKTTSAGARPSRIRFLKQSRKSLRDKRMEARLREKRNAQQKEIPF